MLKYDGKWIVPAPFVSVQIEYQRTPDGTKVGKVYGLTLTGRLLAFNGSPNNVGTFGTSGDLAEQTIPLDQRMDSLCRKREALEALFSRDGMLLEFRANGSSAPTVKCYPRLRNIKFDENLLIEQWPYTIELETDEFIGEPYSNPADFIFNEFISSASESWDLQPSELPYTYALAHTMSAVGKAHYESGVLPSSSWQYAKSFVHNQLGFGADTTTTFSANNSSAVFSGSALNGDIIDIASLSKYNYSVVENIDELAGTYSLTENYILSSGNYTETYAISNSFNYTDGNSTQTASIQGTVKGLFSGINNYTQRYTNAKSGFDNYVRGQLYSRIQEVSSGSSFSTYPLAGSVDYNVIDGTVNYNFTYDNRVTGPSGTIEQYTVSKSLGIEDWLVAVRVEGSIQGRSEYSPANRAAISQYAYQVLDAANTWYTRAQQYTQISGILPLARIKTYSIDPITGILNYSVEFTNRLVNAAVEQYTVQRSFDRNDGLTTVTVQGEILGMATGIYDNYGISGADSVQKFANASGYYVSIEPYLHRRAYALSPIISTGQTVNETLGLNYNMGSISYSVTYNSQPTPLFSGALSEQINVQDVGSGEVWATYQIPGRLAGPITQRMGTRTGRSRTLNIELIMAQPTGTTYSNRFAQKPDPTPIVSAFTISNWLQSPPTENYSITTGRYSYSIQWTENT